MRKICMTLAAVLCCVMAVTLFTACEKDKNKFSYAIIAEPAGTLIGENAVNWRNSVLKVYQIELGTDSEKFTKHGSQEECDKEVLDACKRAEMSLRVSGPGEVKVHNTTANKTVYRRILQ